MAWTWTSLRSKKPRSSAFATVMTWKSQTEATSDEFLHQHPWPALCRSIVDSCWFYVPTLMDFIPMFSADLSASSISTCTVRSCGVLDEGSDRAKRWIHQPQCCLTLRKSKMAGKSSSYIWNGGLNWKMEESSINRELWRVYKWIFFTNIHFGSPKYRFKYDMCEAGNLPWPLDTFQGHLLSWWTRSGWIRRAPKVQMMAAAVNQLGSISPKGKTPRWG